MLLNKCRPRFILLKSKVNERMNNYVLNHYPAVLGPNNLNAVSIDSSPMAKPGLLKYIYSPLCFDVINYLQPEQL